MHGQIVGLERGKDQARKWYWAPYFYSSVCGKPFDYAQEGFLTKRGKEN